MPDACAFCGSVEPLTREHIFGKWVSKIGLDLSPVPHRAGPLNGLPRDIGLQPPYRQTVKDSCSSCNNGWMSQLEVTAQRVLTPLILGKPVVIAPQDQALITMWAQKTALTAMLVSSDEQRADGYGLSHSEYTALYERRHRMVPMEASRYWMGRYEGTAGFWSVRVVPFTIRISGVPEPDVPQGYATTIVLGELVLHGLRFTTPALEVDVTMDLGMPQLWPARLPVRWPAGQPCSAASFLRLADAKMLRSTVEHVVLRPWTQAAELPRSTISQGLVEVPALCRRHTICYPVSLLEEALRGTFYAFGTACACPFGYLIQTESDGAHFKAAGPSNAISEMYEQLSGKERIIRDFAGEFFCKKISG